MSGARRRRSWQAGGPEGEGGKGRVRSAWRRGDGHDPRLRRPQTSDRLAGGGQPRDPGDRSELQRPRVLALPTKTSVVRIFELDNRSLSQARLAKEVWDYARYDGHRGWEGARGTIGGTFGRRRGSGRSRRRPYPSVGIDSTALWADPSGFSVGERRVPTVMKSRDRPQAMAGLGPRPRNVACSSHLFVGTWQRMAPGGIWLRAVRRLPDREEMRTCCCVRKPIGPR